MAKQILHVGPNGRGNDEEQAQADFAKWLMEQAEQKKAEQDAAKKEKGKK